MANFGGSNTGVRSYAGLEMVAAELMDEQPATAAHVRERMRELVTNGGLRMRPQLRVVTTAVDENDPRRFVS